MNLRKNLLGFFGKLWSAPLKFIGESTTFAKNALGGFGGPNGGFWGIAIRVCGDSPSGWSGSGVEEDDEILKGSG